ncbi:MAG: hypothetical protein MJ074_07000 [Oscillospiraceae bacterium]|nr:hypothetical protein [Oscillospiraceae bacterium]
MKRKMWIQALALLLVLSLVGCGNAPTTTPPTSVAQSETTSQAEETEAATETEISVEDTTVQVETSSEVISTEVTEDAEAKAEEEARQKAEEEARQKAEDEARQKAEEEARQKAEEEKRLAEQRNSFSMMYYLAITAEEIRTSKDNRLVLEDMYTSLLNDINPGAVDEITQDHLKNLRDIIKSYLNISTKRERLQFIYNQEKAAAIRNAVPNPLAILSVSNAMDWKKLALTVAYTAVDSYNNYKEAGESADMSFIMSGWELDVEEKDTVMKNRDRAFDYMVNMVRKYNLDGLKTLNETAIGKFAEICATENASERIKLLKAEESKYSLLGNYWLELADAYFETSQYSKCLECVEKYNELATGIYRQDFNYLQILPKAIVAAQNTYSGSKYVTVISEFADAIIANTTSDDWSTRYFAAQVYLDLYSRTNNRAYLENAYKIASENVTVLLKNQRSINATYLADVVEQTAIEPDYRYMTDKKKKDAKKEYEAEKKHVKDYNKALKEARKTELPSLYEPLVVNCELLFALADKMNISTSDKSEIEAILKTDSNGTFLVKPINDAYSFSNTDNKYSIEFTKDEMVIPVNLLTAESTITVSVSDNGQTTKFDDCTITKVERKGKTIDTFNAYVSSKQLKKYTWTANSKITITITYGDAYDKTAVFSFVVSNFAEHWYGNTVEFKAQ